MVTSEMWTLLRKVVFSQGLIRQYWYSNSGPNTFSTPLVLINGPQTDFTAFSQAYTDAYHGFSVVAGTNTPNIFAVDQGLGNHLFTVSTNAVSAFTYGVTAGSLTVNNVASGTQCLHADSSGHITGTGSDCGAGGGSGATSFSALTDFFIDTTTFPNAIAGVGSSCSLTHPCITRFGTVSSSITSSATVIVGADAGSAFVYIDPTNPGAVTVGYGGGSFGNGDVTCNGSCSNAVFGVTQFPTDSVPLYTLTATGAVWTSGTDQRTPFVQKRLIAGSNITLTDNQNTTTISATGGGGSPGSPVGSIQANISGSLAGIPGTFVGASSITIGPIVATTSTVVTINPGDYIWSGSSSPLVGSATDYAFDTSGNSIILGSATIPSGIVGTISGTNAASGIVGEYISSSAVSGAAFPGTGNFGDLVSISLTAGDWDISAVLGSQANSATVTTMSVGISSTTGNSTAGLIEGDSLIKALGPTAATDTFAAIPSFRVSLSSTKTYLPEILGGIQRLHSECGRKAFGQENPMKRLAAIIVLFVTSTACASFSGFTYETAVAVSSANVLNISGTLTNFPMVFTSTAVTFSTSAAGGHLSNPNAFDIVASSDPSCASQYWLNWDTETVNNTGISSFTAWVQIPVMTTATLTAATFYWCYGNSSVTSYQGHSTATWDSNYLLVQHFAVMGSTMPELDSTSNAVNSTKVQASTTTGQIGGGALYNGSQFDTFPPFSTSSFPPSSDVSFWVNINPSHTGFGPIISDGAGSTVVYILNNSGNFHVYPFNSNTNHEGSTNVTAGVWHYIVVRSSGSGAGTSTIFIDGVQDTGGPFASGNFNSQVHYGGDTSAEHFTGAIDEVRVANIWKNDDWIKTEYNNQSAPMTFVTMGQEQGGTPPVVAKSIFTLQGGKLFVCGAKVTIQ